MLTIFEGCRCCPSQARELMRYSTGSDAIGPEAARHSPEMLVYRIEGIDIEYTRPAGTNTLPRTTLLLYRAVVSFVDSHVLFMHPLSQVPSLGVITCTPPSATSSFSTGIPSSRLDMTASQALVAPAWFGRRDTNVTISLLYLATTTCSIYQ